MSKKFVFMITLLFSCILFPLGNLNAVKDQPGNTSIEEKRIYFTPYAPATSDKIQHLLYPGRIPSANYSAHAYLL